MCQIHKLAHSVCKKNLCYTHGKTDSAVFFHNFDLQLWALKAELHNLRFLTEVVGQNTYGSPEFVCISTSDSPDSLTCPTHDIMSKAKPDGANNIQSQAPETGDRSTGPMTASSSWLLVCNKQKHTQNRVLIVQNEFMHELCLLF